MESTQPSTCDPTSTPLPGRTRSAPAGRFVHYTELAASIPGQPLATEFDTYQRHVGRLLAEGHAGRCVLIKGEDVIGVWDSMADAYAEGVRRYQLGGFLTHEIREYEPIYRTGYSRLCLD